MVATDAIGMGLNLYVFFLLLKLLLELEFITSKCLIKLIEASEESYSMHL